MGGMPRFIPPPQNGNMVPPNQCVAGASNHCSTSQNPGVNPNQCGNGFHNGAPVKNNPHYFNYVGVMQGCCDNHHRFPSHPNLANNNSAVIHNVNPCMRPPMVPGFPDAMHPGVCRGPIPPQMAMMQSQHQQMMMPRVRAPFMGPRMCHVAGNVSGQNNTPCAGSPNLDAQNANCPQWNEENVSVSNASTPEKRKRNTSRAKKRLKTQVERSSPCPNVDVRLIRPDPSTPTGPAVSGPSFMDDPSGYLAQQTALLNNTMAGGVGQFSPQASGVGTRAPAATPTTSVVATAQNQNVSSNRIPTGISTASATVVPLPSNVPLPHRVSKVTSSSSSISTTSSVHTTSPVPSPTSVTTISPSNCSCMTTTTTAVTTTSGDISSDCIVTSSVSCSCSVPETSIQQQLQSPVTQSPLELVQSIVSSIPVPPPPPTLMIPPNPAPEPLGVLGYTMAGAPAAGGSGGGTMVVVSSPFPGSKMTPSGVLPPVMQLVNTFSPPVILQSTAPGGPFITSQPIMTTGPLTPGNVEEEGSQQTTPLSTPTPPTPQSTPDTPPSTGGGRRRKRKKAPPAPPVVPAIIVSKQCPPVIMNPQVGGNTGGPGGAINVVQVSPLPLHVQPPPTILVPSAPSGVVVQQVGDGAWVCTDPHNTGAVPLTLQLSSSHIVGMTSPPTMVAVQPPHPQETKVSPCSIGDVSPSRGLTVHTNNVVAQHTTVIASSGGTHSTVSTQTPGEGMGESDVSSSDSVGSMHLPPPDSPSHQSAEVTTTRHDDDMVSPNMVAMEDHTNSTACQGMNIIST